MPNEGLTPLPVATLTWLFLGYAVIWAGIILFLMNMGRRQTRLEHQVGDLERALKR